MAEEALPSTPATPASFGIVDQKTLEDEEAAKREERKAERRKAPITPGPGAFDLPRVFGGKLEGLYSNNPSPVVHRSPVYSLPSACREFEKPDAKSEVGPGSYRPHEFTMRAQSRGCVFGTSERMIGLPTKFVSPSSNLEHRDSNRYPASPRWGFGSCDRSKRGMYDKPLPRGHKMPGPGEHDPKEEGVTSKIASGPDYSFGIRSPHELATRKDPVKVAAGRTAKIFSDEHRFGDYAKVTDDLGSKSKYGITPAEFAGFMVICFNEAVISIWKGARFLRNLPCGQRFDPDSDSFEKLLEDFAFADISLFQRLKEVQHSCNASAEAVVRRFVKLENDHINEDLHNRLLTSCSLREALHEKALSGYDTKENPMIFLFERLFEKQVAAARRPPGPFTYEAAAAADKVSRKSTPLCSFGSTTQRLGLHEKVRNTPGPGAYKSESPSKNNSGPKWSMTSRTGKSSLHHATI